MCWKQYRRAEGRGAVDDDEVKFVKRKFAERKGAGKKVTNNAAVMHGVKGNQ